MSQTVYTENKNISGLNLIKFQRWPELALQYKVPRGHKKDEMIRELLPFPGGLRSHVAVVVGKDWRLCSSGSA